MENNNEQGFSMEEYNKFLKNIKAGSPVHKINFTLESPNAIVGMYLLTMQDTETYLDKIADFENLEENTLLVFESRHVVECCQIIFGCLNILKNLDMYRMKYEVFINEVMDSLLTKPTFYKIIINELTNITHSCIHIDTKKTNEASLIYQKFLTIMQNIWFVPYGQIDEMANKAIKEFKNHYGEGENNE